MKFELGTLVITPNARDSLPADRATYCLQAHHQGVWGDAIAPGDKRVNDRALKHGDRVMSVWHIDPADRGRGTFWIITEADRASTCVLMPEDY